MNLQYECAVTKWGDECSKSKLRWVI